MLFPSLFAAIGSCFAQFILAMLICLASTLPVSALQLNGANLLAGEAVEGGVIIAAVPAGAQVTLDDMSVATDADGRFMIGFHRDSPDIMILRVTGADGVTQQTTLGARQRLYDIQRIDGLKSAYVSPPDDVLARIAADADDVKRARTRHDAGGQAGDDPCAGHCSCPCCLSSCPCCLFETSSLDCWCSFSSGYRGRTHSSSCQG